MNLPAREVLSEPPGLDRRCGIVQSSHSMNVAYGAVKTVEDVPIDEAAHVQEESSRANYFRYNLRTIEGPVRKSTSCIWIDFGNY